MNQRRNGASVHRGCCCQVLVKASFLVADFSLGGRAWGAPSGVFHESTNPVHRGSPSRPVTSQRPPPVGSRTSACEFRGDTDIETTASRFLGWWRKLEAQCAVFIYGAGRPDCANQAVWRRRPPGWRGHAPPHPTVLAQRKTSSGQNLLKVYEITYINSETWSVVLLVLWPCKIGIKRSRYSKKQASHKC